MLVGADIVITISPLRCCAQTYDDELYLYVVTRLVRSSTVLSDSDRLERIKIPIKDMSVHVLSSDVAGDEKSSNRS